MAREFYGLFDLIQDAANNWAETQNPQELSLIREASQLGIQMSTQLLELREGHGTTRVANVQQLMLAAQSLLVRLCGDKVQLEISVLANIGYVLSTGIHFEQLLLHLVSQGKQQVHGNGKLTLTADLHTQEVSSWRISKFIRLAVHAYQRPLGQAEEPSTTATIGAEATELDLAIVRAIATAAEGFVRVKEVDEVTSLIEVYLPRFDSQSEAESASHEYPQIMLIIGLPPSVIESLRETTGDHRLLLEAATLDEAAAISELYGGDIDLMILNTSRFLPGEKERTCERIRARRPDIAFLELASNEDADAFALDLGQLERKVRDVLKGPLNSGTRQPVST